MAAVVDLSASPSASTVDRFEKDLEEAKDLRTKGSYSSFIYFLVCFFIFFIYFYLFLFLFIFIYIFLFIFLFFCFFAYFCLISYNYSTIM